MNKLIYFLILKTTFSTQKFFLRNIELPICTSCVHFIEHTNNYPYDQLPNDKLHGRCKKFGEIDLITGSTIYDFAKDCRNDNKKCGKTGSEYKVK